ncbi:MAG: ABC transporter substrate-binding protein [Propionibacteriaceae bacterium]|jgi:peptide/nickel transport system substrate-binding protein|nr:ABC transporter substrate-binding protein [Propionibacteriaceae bacterium]
MTPGLPPRPLRRPLRLAALLVTAALAGLTACTGTAATDPTDNSSASGQADTSLAVGATLEPSTLDFTASSEAAIGQVLLYNVYETLLRIDQQGELQPLLATGYTLSDDRLTYTFTLDPKATFASGTKVDADAVIKSIERLKPAVNTNVSAPLALVAATEAVDATTVAVTLTHPSNSWLYDMASTAGIVVDPATTDLAQRPAGSGPYQFSTWTRGDQITLTKNQSYWGTPAGFDEVTFRYFSDPNAMNSAELSGGIDIISDLTSPSSLSAFADTSQYQVIDGTTTGEVVLGFNHTKPALQDRRVRQAINYAIDRQSLLDTVWGGKGLLIGSMVAPTDPYYEDLSQTYPYDPEKAKALLAEAGQENLTLALRVPVVPYATSAAQVIASMLGQVGVTVEVSELDFGTWYTQVFTDGDFDMTIVNHVETRDIVQFANPGYYWHYDNADFQALIAQADEAAPDEYVPLMKQAAQLLADDAAADWLWSFPSLTVARADLTGIPQNSTTTSFDLTQIRSKA